MEATHPAKLAGQLLCAALSAIKLTGEGCAGSCQTSLAQMCYDRDLQRPDAVLWGMRSQKKDGR